MIHGLTRGSFSMKSSMSTTKITNDGEVAQRLDPNRPRCVIGEEGGTRQFRLALDVHPAAAADSHPARPAIRQAAVYVVLDVVQPSRIAQSFLSGTS